MIFGSVHGDRYAYYLDQVTPEYFAQVKALNPEAAGYALIYTIRSDGMEVYPYAPMMEES